MVCVHVLWPSFIIVCSRSLSSTSCCLIEIQMRIAFHQTHISLFLFYLWMMTAESIGMCLHAFVEISLYRRWTIFELECFEWSFFLYNKMGNHKPVSMSHQKPKSHAHTHTCILHLQNWKLDFFCTFFLFLATWETNNQMVLTRCGYACWGTRRSMILI